MKTDLEEWRSIPGYEGMYEASDLGRIRSVDRVVIDRLGRTARLKGQLLTQGQRKRGYLRCIVSKGGICRDSDVHVLVCTAFHGPRPEGKWVRHLDGKHLNNVPDNLAWGTPQENMNDQYRHGTRLTGERMPQSKFTPDDVRVIRSLYAEGHTQVSLAAEYGVRQSAISAIVNRINWAHVE